MTMELDSNHNISNRRITKSSSTALTLETTIIPKPTYDSHYVVEELDMDIGAEPIILKGKSKSKSVRDHDHISLDVEDERREKRQHRSSSRRDKSRTKSDLLPQRKDKSGTESNQIVGISLVLESMNECVAQIHHITTRFADFANNHKLVCKQKGKKLNDPGPELVQIAEVANDIMSIAQGSFTAAHRLCQTAIGLYLTEDFIRDPHKDPSYDYFTQGRIRVPSKSSNQTTLKKIKTCVMMASDICNKWSKVSYKGTVVKRRIDKDLKQLCEILSTFRSAIQNFYNAAVGSVRLFDLLIYLNPKGKSSFFDFLQSLGTVEKADLLEDISTLRRLIDYIPILFEKLSLKCFAVQVVAGCANMEKDSFNPCSPTESNDSSCASSATNSKQSFEVVTKAIGNNQNHRSSRIKNKVVDQNGNELYAEGFTSIDAEDDFDIDPEDELDLDGIEGAGGTNGNLKSCLKKKEHERQGRSSSRRSRSSTSKSMSKSSRTVSLKASSSSSIGVNRVKGKSSKEAGINGKDKHHNKKEVENKRSDTEYSSSGRSSQSRSPNKHSKSCKN